MSPQNIDLKVVPDPVKLAARAAELFIRSAQVAIAEGGRFRVALSGGSTPKAMFLQISRPVNLRQVDWTRVHLFWGDERCVPADHVDSNYQMTRQSLLDFVPIPARNVHRIPGEFEPDAAAAAYEDVLKKHFGSETFPRFDLILLGLGEDGHTASLFPGSPALVENGRWVVAVEHNIPPVPMVPRVTLTFPVINAAKRVVFLVVGQSKAEILARVIQPPGLGEIALPAQLICPLDGTVTWLVDQAAGKFIRLDER
jgi:6-phosphogluconolactonase